MISDVQFPRVTGIRFTEDDPDRFGYLCRMPDGPWVWWASIVTNDSRGRLPSFLATTLPYGMTLADSRLAKRIQAGEHSPALAYDIIHEPNIPPEAKVNLLLNLWKCET